MLVIKLSSPKLLIKPQLKPLNQSQNLKSLLDNVVLDPKKFVAEVAKLDPVALNTIIVLLRELLTTSEQRETTLNGNIDDANTALNGASTAVANAETDLDAAKAAVADAKADLEEVERQAAADIAAAETALAEAQQAKGNRQGELDDAKEHHQNKVQEKTDAEDALSGETDSLVHEQKVLREVIAILEGLHGDASTRLEAQYWITDGGVEIADGLAKASESAVNGAMTTKTSFTRPIEVSWTAKMVDTRGDQCIVMDVFPQTADRHSGYSIGAGWWGHFLGYSVDTDHLDDARAEGRHDGELSVYHTYKLVLTSDEVIWYADDVEFHREADTQYMEGTIRVGRACRGWETSDVTVTPL